MTELISWLSTNRDLLIQILTGIVTVASLIATLIPNDSANRWIARANRVVSWLALNVGNAKSEKSKDQE